jgi:hypothetical protein
VVHVEEDDDELKVLFFEHSFAEPVGEHDAYRKRLTSGFDEYDVVTFDKRTRNLVVRTWFSALLDDYRRLFGTVLFDDDGYFCQTVSYTGEPFIRLGASATSRRDQDDDYEVRLRRIRLENPDLWESIEWMGTSLASRLDTPVGRVLRRHGTITAYQLEMVFDCGEPSLLIDVRVPRVIKISSHPDREIGLKYLRKSGFMVSTDWVTGINS